MKAKKINLILGILITVFMGAMLALSARHATEIATVGAVMFVFNSGVPVNIILDKFIQLRGFKNE